MLNFERQSELNRIKKFAQKSFLFLSAFLVISYFLNMLYTNVILSNSVIFRTERQFESVKQDVRILGIGDSHIKYGLHAEYLETSFVIANAAENYIQTYYKLNSYFDDGSLDLALIIMPIDLHSFSSYGKERFENLEFWKKFLNYQELAIQNRDLPRFFNLWLRGEFVFIGGIVETLELIQVNSNEKSVSELVSGYQPKDGDFGEFGKKGELAALRVDYHLRGSNALDPELLDYFFRILALARENNVQVVLVRFPVTAEYYSSAMALPSISDHYENLDLMLAQNGFGSLPILNYHDIFWGQSNLFADSDHLNEQGAILFTQIVKGDLDEFGLLP
jgi:hypothetical protein